METLKKNVITVENIREEIERAKLEVPREDEDFDCVKMSIRWDINENLMKI